MQHNTLSMYNSLIGRKMNRIALVHREYEKAVVAEWKDRLEEVLATEYRDLERIFAVRNSEVNGGIYV